MLKWLITLLLVRGSLWAQEVKRPTAEYNLVSCVTAPLQCDGQVTFPNAYDGSGIGTSTSRTLTAIYPGTDDYEQYDGFTTWASASGTYTSYVLKVNSTCTKTAIAAGYIDYSTNAGSSWTSLKSGSWTNETTTSAVISGSIALSQLRVRVYQVATDGSTISSRGASTLTLYDIWTEGTLSGASSSKNIPYVIVN
jgi:hypothetical protein